MTTRYAITHINKDGIRQLTFANQGRNHSDTREHAEMRLANLRANNTPAVMQMYYYKGKDTFQIREVECYPSGDAHGIYFEDPDAPFDKKMKAAGLNTRDKRPQAEALNWITMVEPETGRQSSLGIYGRTDRGCLRVVGNLEHSAEIEPATIEDCNKLIRWLTKWRARREAAEALKETEQPVK